MEKTNKNARVKGAAPEPEVLRIIGAKSKMKRTDKLSPQQIDKIIGEIRTRRPKRR